MNTCSSRSDSKPVLLLGTVAVLAMLTACGAGEGVPGDGGPDPQADVVEPDTSIDPGSPDITVDAQGDRIVTDSPDASDSKEADEPVPCTDFYRDEDEDGFGTDESECLLAPEAPFTAIKAGDCDDGNPEIHPDGVETCNGIDDDCDGDTDADLCPEKVYYCDEDSDEHFSSAVFGTCRDWGCVPIGCQEAQGDDCDDQDPLVHPGSEETCNGVDDNCVNGADEGGVCPVVSYYCDSDEDDHASLSPTGTCGTFECVPTDCWIEPGEDCNDNETLVHPEAQEVCNGIDDNCVDGVDEGGVCGDTIYYCDNDSDLYYASTTSGSCGTFDCIPPGCIDMPGNDCNDNDPLVNPGMVEVCNGIDDDCVEGADNGSCPEVTYFCDNDDDGYLSQTSSGTCSSFDCMPQDCGEQAGDDCNDNKPLVNPGMEEVCNGIDDDCTDGVDEDGVCEVTAYYCDVDEDGFVSTEESGSCDNFDCVPGGCVIEPGADCNDNKQLVNPDAQEDCGTEYDDNCDGYTNDLDGIGCVDYWLDGDGDGYYVSGAPSQCRCGPDDGYTALVEGDCNDSDPEVNVGADEVCNAVDDDCDGQTDEDDVCGITQYYCDLDSDLHTAAVASGSCDTANCVPEGCDVQPGEDCDDDNPAANPDAEEDCDTPFDDDCDGQSDEEDALNCTVYHRDLDEDGFGHTDDYKCLCAPNDLYDVTVPDDTDCNDNNLNIFPGAEEVCNGMDDNCEGQTDEGFVCPFVTYYCDQDEDGHASNFLSGTCSTYNCVPPGCVSDVGGDCNDNNADIHPDAEETCNGKDDNCAGGVDEGGVCPEVPYYCDQDEDGWVSTAPSGTCDTHDCMPVGCQGVPGPDCNDNNAGINPGAEEVCNGIDENCDSETDEGGVCPDVPYYCDNDADLHVSMEVTGNCQAFQCVPGGCQDVPGGDCNDNNPNIYPGAEEVCNGIDDDCDSETDEGYVCPFVTYYCDQDEDGHASDFLSGVCSTYNCLPSGCVTSQGDDCNDNNAGIHPDAEETCNGIDDNCAGGVDEDGVCPEVEYHCDHDEDGWISTAPSGTCDTHDCIPLDCQGVPGPDCNDNDAGISPDAIETCDGVDEDCSGVIDDGGVCPVVFYYCDQDEDLHVSEQLSGTCQAFECVPDGCQEAPGGDCDDDDADVNPDAAEACNGIDDDCDGLTDEADACPTVPFYCDEDNDQYVSSIESGNCSEHECIPQQCQAAPGDDCDDQEPEVNPGVAEECDGIDNDCSGDIDDGGVCPIVEYYCDDDSDGYISEGLSGSCQIWQCMPQGCTGDSGLDCDDGAASVHPGAMESCNGIDDDCNGLTDDNTCLIDGTCWEAMEPNPDDPCFRCDPATDPFGWTDFNGAPCDDGLDYTVNDMCEEGVCEGEFAPCFDTIAFGDALRVQSMLVGDDGNPGQGLDVDGDPDTCQPAGVYSDGSPICSEGIDNKMSLVDIILNGELPGQFEDGNIHFIPEFLDWTDDGAPFELAFHNGTPDPADPACDFTLPGCMYLVPYSGFDDECRRVLRFDNAAINGTLLTAGGPGHVISLEMPFIGDMIFEMTLYHAQIEGEVTVDQGTVVFLDGILAGALSQAEVLAAIDMVPEDMLPMPKDQIIGLLTLLLTPDIDFDGDGEAESISLGLLIQADQAIISGLYE